MSGYARILAIDVVAPSLSAVVRRPGLDGACEISPYVQSDEPRIVQLFSGSRPMATRILGRTRGLPMAISPLSVDTGIQKQRS